MAKKKKDESGAEVEQVEETSEPASEGMVSDETVKEAAAELVSEMPAPAPLKKYRVLEEKHASLNGHITWFRKGDILDEAHYGKDHVAKLAHSLKLEEVK